MKGWGRKAETRPADLLRGPWQSDSLVVCEVDPELKEKLRKFRFRKETDNAAIISEWPLPSLMGEWGLAGRVGT